MASKNKKLKKNKKDKKLSKKQRIAARKAKLAAKKGDGSFPDTLVVTKNDTNEEHTFFEAHNGEDLSTLDTDGETVAVYKLRKVSTISVKRKITR